MKYCKKCDLEINEDVELCTKCGKALETRTEALLTTVNSDIEADIIESLMSSYEIPVIRKHKLLIGNIAKLYTGTSNTGVDIFVPEAFIVQAKEILEYNSPEKEDVITDNSETSKKRE